MGQAVLGALRVWSRCVWYRVLSSFYKGRNGDTGKHGSFPQATRSGGEPGALGVQPGLGAAPA